MNKETEEAAKKIWEYMRLGHTLEKADAIVVFCSYDLLVAKYAARLYYDGYAPLLVFSGGSSGMTKEWSTSEAKRFKEVAITEGVPENVILTEDRSTNTLENISFTRQLLREKGIILQTAILVHKPFMERRVYRTLQKQWNEVSWIVTSPPITFEEYEVPGLSRDELIGFITGDLERIELYGKKGDIEQEDIPKEIWEAHNIIRSNGYMRRYKKVD